MKELIKTYSEIISTDNKTNYEISMENNLSHDLLHCEQLFLYECLKDDVIISNLLNNLPLDCDLSSLYSEADFISFDIITYNDMCHKCFESCEGNFYDLESRFNRILVEKLHICGKLKEALDKRENSFLPLKIRISSFKPYRTSRTKGDGYNPYDYLTYGKVSNPKAGKGGGNIVQFFNPFITQFTLMNNVNQLHDWIEEHIIENACYINTYFLPNLLKEANNIEKHLLSNAILKNIINNLENTESAIIKIIKKLEANNQFKKLNNKNKDNIKTAIVSIKDDIIKLHEIFKNK